MLIGEVFIRDAHLILRDVDGSETSLTLTDTLELMKWLLAHVHELREAVKQQEEHKS